MPISKNNHLYFTADQKHLADQNSNALQYALSQGYELVRHGNYYSMKEHDSMVFKLDGSWFWNSKRLHGRAIEFIQHYEGKSFVEAVLALSGESSIPRTPASILPRASPGVPFEAPKCASSQKQMYGYLCGTRKIDPRIIKAMMDQKILYQSDYTTASGKVVHNACFLSYDDKGKACSAYKRGTATLGAPYKGEVPGGDKSFGWTLHGENPERLYVFEAAIDAASYASLRLHNGENPLVGVDYLALGGLSFQPIQTYLNHHPEIKSVNLLLDNDVPGLEAAAAFQKRLSEAGIEATIKTPPSGKDWNEYLQQKMTALESRSSLPDRSPGPGPPTTRAALTAKYSHTPTHRTGNRHPHSGYER